MSLFLVLILTLFYPRMTCLQFKMSNSASKIFNAKQRPLPEPCQQTPAHRRSHVNNKLWVEMLCQLKSEDYPVKNHG
jgi:hypothetical protein